MADAEAREQARQLVMDTFETLVVYMRGVIPNPKGRYIDVMMKSRAAKRAGFALTGGRESGRRGPTGQLRGGLDQAADHLGVAWRAAVDYQPALTLPEVL